MADTDSHTMIVKSIEALGAKVSDGFDRVDTSFDKVDSRFNEVNSSIVKLKVAHATVSTQVESMKDSSTTIKKELAIVRESQLTCPGRLNASKLDDVSQVVELPQATGMSALDNAFILKIPKWMVPVIIAAIAAAGIAVPLVGCW